MSEVNTINSPARIKKIEQAIQEMVTCLGFETSDDPFCIKSIHSTFLYANLAYKTLFGIAASCDLKGRTEADFPCHFSRFASDIQQYERKVMFQKKTLRAMVTCPPEGKIRGKFALEVISDADFPLHFPASRITEQVKTAMTKNQGSLITYPIHRDTCQKYTFDIRCFDIDNRVVGVHYWGKKSGFYVDPVSQCVFFF